MNDRKKSIHPKKSTLLPILGVVLSLVSLLLIAAAIYSLHGVSQVSRALADVTQAQHASFNEADWKDHYAIYWITWLIAACVGAIAGLLMVLRKRLGLALLMVSTLTLLLYPLAMKVVGWGQYRFETANYLTVAILLVVLFYAIAAFRQFHHRKA